MKEKKRYYTIGVVAQMYSIHPQTLRLYEKEGLLKPSRTKGKTRHYTDEDLQRLEFILTLTRELGVNLAGVDVILRMKEQMEEMERQIEKLIEFIQRELSKACHEDENIKSIVLSDRKSVLDIIGKNETKRN
ncbi:MAG: heat shock protein transcriptional repressor HspR [Hydrogenobacter sp.]